MGIQFSHKIAAVNRLDMADMLLASGNLDRADALYRDLAQDAPNDADVSAALGTIALRRGDKDRARQEWKLAIGQGIQDAALCFQYESLAELAGVPEDELRPVLVVGCPEVCSPSHHSSTK